MPLFVCLFVCFYFKDPQLFCVKPNALKMPLLTLWWPQLTFQHFWLICRPSLLKTINSVGFFSIVEDDKVGVCTVSFKCSFSFVSKLHDFVFEDKTIVNRVPKQMVLLAIFGVSGPSGSFKLFYIRQLDEISLE